MLTIVNTKAFLVLLAAAVALTSAGCTGGGSTAPAGTGGGTDTTGSDSAGAGAETTAAVDTTATTDSGATADATVGGDGAIGVDSAGDAKPADGSVDVGGVDGAGDTGAGDTGAGDTGAGDVSKPPFACKTDAECKALVMGPCVSAQCATGTCVVAAAADKSACTATGACGGTGSCGMGACQYTSPCLPAPCNAAALKCGDKVSFDAATMGASKMGVYSCTAAKWSGGEKAFSLATDTTQVAAIELAAAASWTVLDLSPNAAGLCLPGKCMSAGPKLLLGLQPGKPRLLIVDSMGTGTATLTVTCTAGLPTCGDSKCDPVAGETCGNCGKDCGACKDACTTSKAPGCKDNPCEACACAKDPYCCKTAWDTTCQSACKSCNAGKCGDAVCTAPETCGSCPKDCGGCGDPAPPKCGDGKCEGNEHCGVCPTDCGKCGDYACTCKADSFCCTGSFDSLCFQACAKCAGGPCPKPTCGDGMCVGKETCSTCAKDCGDCPKPVCGDSKCEAASETCTSCAKDCGDCPKPVCGNGKCEAGETLSTCPKDCTVAAIGCEGHCDDSSKDAKGDTCWCDDVCQSSGDCCDDKAKFCP